MAAEVLALEADSSAALDALAQRVTAGNLDAVRRVKNRMVRLNTRVETVRTLLEKYLADDADLAELHLSGQRCASNACSCRPVRNDASTSYVCPTAGAVALLVCSLLCYSDCQERSMSVECNHTTQTQRVRPTQLVTVHLYTKACDLQP